MNFAIAANETIEPESNGVDDNLQPLERRIKNESETLNNPFSITPHKPNYLLPLTYNDSPNDTPFAGTGDTALSNWEAKFQLSFKIPLTAKVSANGGLAFAYTQTSFWQAYDGSNSSPFRETNHEPEFFYGLPNDYKLFGFTNRLIIFGISHQSNGRSQSLSRSWNRLYTIFLFERDKWAILIKPWWRIPENSASDDNPDIEDFLGHGELTLLYTDGLRSRGATLRYHNSTGKGAIQLNWTFPLTTKYKGYIQYFKGYGESLIDYNARTERLGIGIILTDWL